VTFFVWLTVVSAAPVYQPVNLSLLGIVEWLELGGAIASGTGTLPAVASEGARYTDLTTPTAPIDYRSTGGAWAKMTPDTVAAGEPALATHAALTQDPHGATETITSTLTVGSGGADIELYRTTGGFLELKASGTVILRITATEAFFLGNAVPNNIASSAIDTMSSVSTGAIVFNTDIGKHQAYNGVSWGEMGGGGDTSGLQPIASMSLYASASIGINAQSATYTLVIGDAGKLVRMSTASTTTTLVQSVIIPSTTTVAWAIGDQVSVSRADVGEVCIVGDAGVTINSTASPSATPWLAVQHAAATCVCVASDVWLVSGFVGDAK